MKRRIAIATVGALVSSTTLTAWAQEETVKVGLILPMTGPFASTGKQIEAAVRLYMAQRGTTAGGKKIEILLRDDAGVADSTRRIAQELIVTHKVAALAGFGLTPSALAVGPLATQAKTPAVIMSAGSAAVMPASSYFVRTSYTVKHTAAAMAQWAAKNKISKVVTMVTDFAPGVEAEKAFKEQFEASGGKLLEAIRVPVRSPDFAPFLQRVRDMAPDAVYVFIPSGPGAALMKQFKERGLDKSGIKLIGDGGVTDDDTLNEMGDVALGVVTAFHYSAAHESPVNAKFVQAFQSANNGLRPNFMAVGGYDGMNVIYNAIEATKGQARGDALLAAMKGQAFESPRGPVQIDAKTGDIAQNVYVRRVERKDGQIYNIEIDTLKSDPAAASAK